MIAPFDPGVNETIAQANAVTSAGGTLPEDCNVVALYNTSASAVAYFVCVPTIGRTAEAAVVPSGGTLGSLPIPPGQMIRISVPNGPKAFRTIASAADGNLLISPGRGN